MENDLFQEANMIRKILSLYLISAYIGNGDRRDFD